MESTELLPNLLHSYDIILLKGCPYYKGLRACHYNFHSTQGILLKRGVIVIASGMFQTDDISNRLLRC